MSLYRNRILPWLMERVLTRPPFLAQRLEALREARGRVLEIGFGFGASLGAYPAGPGGIESLVAVEPNPGMLRRAAARVARARFPVRVVRAVAEALPLRGGAFDTVVTNWTLCSVAAPRTALAEIRRVLRPGGRFLFLEHGRADERRLARLQAWLTPLQRRLADGCRLDLAVDEEIVAAGLRLDRLETYEAPTWGPRALRQMFRGSAGDPAAPGRAGEAAIPPRR